MYNKVNGCGFFGKISQNLSSTLASFTHKYLFEGECVVLCGVICLWLCGRERERKRCVGGAEGKEGRKKC